MLLILLSCCFFWGNDEFELNEELAPMNSVCGTTTNENIFKEVQKKMNLVQAEVESAKMYYYLWW